MERRYRPYRPHAAPGDQPGGWVVAGEEHNSWVPHQRNGRGGEPEGWYAQTYDPGYGGQRYGEQPEPGYPAPGHDPGYPAPGPGPGYLPPDPAGGYLPGPYLPEPHRPPAPGDPYRGRPDDSYPGTAYPPDPAYPPPERIARPYPAARRPGLPRRAAADPRDDPPAPAWTAALLWTLGLFLMPVLMYLAWALTLSGVAPAGCVDAAGAACPPPRTEAVGQLADALPAAGGALTLALLVALAVRRIAGDWRGFTVGFAAAVIGAGLATLVAAILG